jgi:hypothetical protein
MSVNSGFKRWFVRLHGKRPCWKGLTDEELQEMASAGDEARAEMGRRYDYDRDMRVSREAWIRMG